MRLEVEAEVQEGLPQDTGVTQEEGDQEPPNAAVPVEEGVDRLELHVSEAGPETTTLTTL